MAEKPPPRFPKDPKPKMNGHRHKLGSGEANEKLINLKGRLTTRGRSGGDPAAAEVAELLASPAPAVAPETAGAVAGTAPEAGSTVRSEELLAEYRSLVNAYNELGLVLQPIYAGIQSGNKFTPSQRIDLADLQSKLETVHFDLMLVGDCFKNSKLTDEKIWERLQQFEYAKTIADLKKEFTEYVNAVLKTWGSEKAVDVPDSAVAAPAQVLAPEAPPPAVESGDQTEQSDAFCAEADAWLRERDDFIQQLFRNLVENLPSGVAVSDIDPSSERRLEQIKQGLVLQKDRYYALLRNAKPGENLPAALSRCLDDYYRLSNELKFLVDEISARHQKSESDNVAKKVPVIEATPVPQPERVVDNRVVTSPPELGVGDLIKLGDWARAQKQALRDLRNTLEEQLPDGTTLEQYDKKRARQLREFEDKLQRILPNLKEQLLKEADNKHLQHTLTQRAVGHYQSTAQRIHDLLHELQRSLGRAPGAVNQSVYDRSRTESSFVDGIEEREGREVVAKVQKALTPEQSVPNNNKPEDGWSTYERSLYDAPAKAPDVEGDNPGAPPNWPHPMDEENPSMETGQRPVGWPDPRLEHDERNMENLGVSPEQSAAHEAGGVSSFEELYDLIRRFGTVQGSRETFSADALIEIIDKVRSGEGRIQAVTSSLGIREAVTRLLALNVESPLPEPTAAREQDPALRPLFEKRDALMEKRSEIKTKWQEAKVAFEAEQKRAFEHQSEKSLFGKWFGKETKVDPAVEERYKETRRAHVAFLRERKGIHQEIVNTWKREGQWKVAAPPEPGKVRKFDAAGMLQNVMSREFVLERLATENELRKEVFEKAQATNREHWTVQTSRSMLEKLRAVVPKSEVGKIALGGTVAVLAGTGIAVLAAPTAAALGMASLFGVTNVAAAGAMAGGARFVAGYGLGRGGAAAVREAVNRWSTTKKEQRFNQLTDQQAVADRMRGFEGIDAIEQSIRDAEDALQKSRRNQVIAGAVVGVAAGGSAALAAPTGVVWAAGQLDTPPTLSGINGPEYQAQPAPRPSGINGPEGQTLSPILSGTNGPEYQELADIRTNRPPTLSGINGPEYQAQPAPRPSGINGPEGQTLSPILSGTNGPEGQSIPPILSGNNGPEYQELLEGGTGVAVPDNIEYRVQEGNKLQLIIRDQYRQLPGASLEGIPRARLNTILQNLTDAVQRDPELRNQIGLEARGGRPQHVDRIYTGQTLKVDELVRRFDAAIAAERAPVLPPPPDAPPFPGGPVAAVAPLPEAPVARPAGAATVRLEEAFSPADQTPEAVRVREAVIDRMADQVRAEGRAAAALDERLRRVTPGSVPTPAAEENLAAAEASRAAVMGELNRGISNLTREPFAPLPEARGGVNTEPPTYQPMRMGSVPSGATGSETLPRFRGAPTPLSETATNVGTPQPIGMRVVPPPVAGEGPALSVPPRSLPGVPGVELDSPVPGAPSAVPRFSEVIDASAAPAYPPAVAPLEVANTSVDSVPNPASIPPPPTAGIFEPLRNPITASELRVTGTNVENTVAVARGVPELRHGLITDAAYIRYLTEMSQQLQDSTALEAYEERLQSFTKVSETVLFELARKNDLDTLPRAGESQEALRQRLFSDLHDRFLTPQNLLIPDELQLGKPDFDFAVALRYPAPTLAESLAKFTEDRVGFDALFTPPRVTFFDRLFNNRSYGVSPLDFFRESHALVDLRALAEMSAEQIDEITTNPVVRGFPVNRVALERFLEMLPKLLELLPSTSPRDEQYLHYDEIINYLLVHKPNDMSQLINEITAIED